jgi:hypothetical protein
MPVGRMAIRSPQCGLKVRNREQWALFAILQVNCRRAFSVVEIAPAERAGFEPSIQFCKTLSLDIS